MNSHDRTQRDEASEHDRSYKRLFSHPAAVEELFRGFLREDWAAGLDLSTLERVGGSFVSDNLRERHNDLIWRLRFRDGERKWFYLYVLLELQSPPYHFMAVRLLSYVSLLLEGIIRQEKLKAGDLLPAVLPMVLYNGRREWRAPQDLGSLYPTLPPGLRRRLPDLSYVLLDENRLDLERPELVANRVAALFQIERCEDGGELSDLMDRFTASLNQDGGDPELRRAYGIWIRSVLRRTFPEDIISSTVDLEEATMLEENMKIWAGECAERRSAKARSRPFVMFSCPKWHSASDASLARSAPESEK